MWVGGLGSSTSFVGVNRFPVLCGFGTVDVVRFGWFLGLVWCLLGIVVFS